MTDDQRAAIERALAGPVYVPGVGVIAMGEMTEEEVEAVMGIGKEGTRHDLRRDRRDRRDRLDLHGCDPVGVRLERHDLVLSEEETKVSESTGQRPPFVGDGVSDEQRVAGFRDKYGRVVYDVMLTQGVIEEWEWENAEVWRRELCRDIAEAVIDAFVTGEREEVSG